MLLGLTVLPQHYCSRCSHSRQGLVAVAVAVAVLAVSVVAVPLVAVLTMPSGCKRPAQLWWKEL